MLNLLANAVKFTSHGEVFLRVLLQDGSLSFEVQDNGIGMTEDQQTRLFQPFFQADASTTRRFGGTGLGLAICKRLVEIMNGRIGVKSAPVCDAFVEFFPELLETARNALVGRDRDTLHDKAHAAKGAARSVCAERLSAILAELEKSSQGRTSFLRLDRMLKDAEAAYGEVAAFIGQRRE